MLNLLKLIFFNINKINIFYLKNFVLIYKDYDFLEELTVLNDMEF